MPTFEELKQRYMISSLSTGGGSLSAGTASAIPTHSNCHVTPHLSGSSYFAELKQSINALSGNGAFIYIAGWWFQSTFSLDGQSSGSSMINLLKAKARAGVDVRILGWVFCPELLQSNLLRGALSAGGVSMNGARDFLQQIDDTMNVILALRTEPALVHKASLNILAHPAGAVHTKFVVLGDNSNTSFYTGGLDLQAGRWSSTWHDVQAEVAGSVVQDAYNFYREMWNENQGRSTVSLTGLHVTCDSRSPSMPTMPVRTMSSSTSSRMHMQSLRTLPQFHFSTLASAVLPTNPPLSYMPRGKFEIKAAWAHAINNAESYIYIEDQAFTSTEIFDLINAKIKTDNDIRVILVIGKPDPNDPPNSPFRKYLRVAVNNHLLKGLSPAQWSRVGLFRHKSKVIHSKATILDDRWGLIGSANAMRRSLYTDVEHSVAFMDEDNHNSVISFRTDLWGTHVPGISHNLSTALSEWFAIPFVGSSGTSTALVERRTLPMTTTTLSTQEQTLYNEIYDADSRQTWGTSLWRLITSSGGSGRISP